VERELGGGLSVQRSIIWPSKGMGTNPRCNTDELENMPSERNQSLKATQSRIHIIKMSKIDKPMETESR
jgi:hypothetical protein